MAWSSFFVEESVIVLVLKAITGCFYFELETIRKGYPMNKSELVSGLAKIQLHAAGDRDGDNPSVPLMPLLCATRA